MAKRNTNQMQYGPIIVVAAITSAVSVLVTRLIDRRLPPPAPVTK